MSLDEDKAKQIQKIVDEQKVFESVVEKKKSGGPKTSEMIESMHQGAIAAVVEGDDDIKKRFIEQGKKTIDTELDIIEKTSEARRQQATYDVNAEACRNYGIDKSVPIWQVRLMRAGSAFWFVIYFIIASVSIAPIMIFVKGISSFIKQTWIAILLALIGYALVVVGIPLAVKYIIGG